MHHAGVVCAPYQECFVYHTDDSACITVICAPSSKNTIKKTGGVNLLCSLLQQEASFLLWYHSLFNGGEKVPELLGHGLVPACLQVLDGKQSRTPDKTCATGRTQCCSRGLNDLGVLAERAGLIGFAGCRGAELIWGAGRGFKAI